MDYKGVLKDLKRMRDRAHMDKGWCEHGDRWRRLALFIIEIDHFIEDIECGVTTNSE